eukprot:s627_g45.t1
MSGVRLVMGDYNQEPGQLTQQQIWLRHGRRNAQDVAAELFFHEILPTCKGVNQRDQIWLSPEAIQLLRGIAITDVFVDHSTVAIHLQVPTSSWSVSRWPRPAPLPWNEFDLSQWDPECSQHFGAGTSSTEFMQKWAQEFEDAVSTQVQEHSGKPISRRSCGRAQRLQPLSQVHFTPTTRSSREGEVKPLNSMAGTATRLWFKQLRRFQGLKHAVAANKQTDAALTYRLELWSSIRRSSGFYPDFPTWWSAQQHEIAGVPGHLPHAVPTELVLVQAMYDSFHVLFRAFEDWHLKQRSQSLKLKYAGSLEAVYADLRPGPRPGVTHIWKEEVYTILAIDVEGHQIQLDKHVQTKFDSVWYHDQHLLSITGVSADLCTVSSVEHLVPGDELVQRYFLTDTNDVLSAFAEHWKPRWNSLAQVSDHDWQRITGFARHYMLQLHFDWRPLDEVTWRKTVKRFKPRAARGPDGFSKEDLTCMPTSFLSALLQMLHAVETTDVAWPTQLAFGTVLGLSKCDNAHLEGQYRPITLFSAIYRTWARLRTHQFLWQMAQHIPPEALGFLPHRETTEVWLSLQALIELSVQSKTDMAGLSTDLRRAFNHIGREQTFMVATHLGLPEQLLQPWKKFLRQFRRRFDVQGCLGEEIASDSGFPEGCPLSIISMLTVNWSYHIYMRAFCPRVTAYSFVDNLTLAAREAWVVAQAFFALRSVCLLFGLATDDDKTYVWALTPLSRTQMSQLGFPCYSDASELGGAGWQVTAFAFGGCVAATGCSSSSAPHYERIGWFRWIPHSVG